MHMTKFLWEICYEHKGEKKTVTIELALEPDEEMAAQKIKRKLLGENFLIPVTPVGLKKPTVFLLQSYGYHIVHIRRI